MSDYYEDEWYEDEDFETALCDMLEECAWKLDVLYELERYLAPFVDDGVRGEIYALQDRRDELKRQIAKSTLSGQPLTPTYPTQE